MNHFLPRIDGGAREALGCSHEPDQIDARVYPAKLGCSLCNCVFYRGRLFCIQCEMRQIINSVPLYSPCVRKVVAPIGLVTSVKCCKFGGGQPPLRLGRRRF